MTLPERIHTIDAHAAGEPLRIVTDGFPAVPGDTMLAKRAHARAHLDHIRRALMLEPRGHADMYGAIPTEPVTSDGDLGVLFVHNEGYSTMCGHGIIALVTVGLERGLFTPREGPEKINIDTPAGRVTARATMRGERVDRVSFRNVPSFVVVTDHRVEPEGVRPVAVDIAFGGAFYAYVDATGLGLEVVPQNRRAFIDLAQVIKRELASARLCKHPDGDPDLDFLYGVIFTEPGRDGHHSRNVCIFADGEVDRSPTGTGVSGRAALLHAAGELPVGQWITVASLIGTCFDVRVAETCDVGHLPGIVPEVAGSAHTTGLHTFVFEPEDPLLEGVLLR